MHKLFNFDSELHHLEGFSLACVFHAAYDVSLLCCVRKDAEMLNVFEKTLEKLGQHFFKKMIKRFTCMYEKQKSLVLTETYMYVYQIYHHCLVLAVLTEGELSFSAHLKELLPLTTQRHLPN